MTTHEIIVKVYKHFTGLILNGKIPVDMAAPSLVGTVQSDPFDKWVGSEMVKALPGLEITHVGSLTTPDIIIRDKSSGVIVGIEVKKLLQKKNGMDARGLTMDYNSCIPCGSAMIRLGKSKDLVQIPCFYFFALLSIDSRHIVTLILLDGDFLNYDFNLHKEAKVANITEYGHGPYGEGSVRRRAMYTYPNPLNAKLAFFHLRKTLVMKKFDAENRSLQKFTTHHIQRDDKFGNSFLYSVVDQTVPPTKKDPILLKDVFSACKLRKPKERAFSTPVLRSA